MKIKVIVIDAQHRIMYSTFVENTFNQLKKIISCTGFERISLSKRESLFIDEDGLFTAKMAFSLDRGANLHQFCLPYFAGSGIIAGVAADGSLTDCVSETENILPGLQFFDISNSDYTK